MYDEWAETNGMAVEVVAGPVRDEDLAVDPLTLRLVSDHGRVETPWVQDDNYEGGLPSASEVLEGLVGQVRSVAAAESFHAWARNVGYELDSIEDGEAEYRQISALRDPLAAVLGGEEALAAAVAARE